MYWSSNKFLQSDNPSCLKNIITTGKSVWKKYETWENNKRDPSFIR